MTTTNTTQEQRKQPGVKYICWNEFTGRWDEVFPESQIGDHELVIPLFWGGKGYVSVPGTEFYGLVPEGGI